MFRYSKMKRIEKIIRGNTLKKEKETRVKFNLRLALIDLQTTGPKGFSRAQRGAFVHLPTKTRAPNPREKKGWVTIKTWRKHDSPTASARDFSWTFSGSVKFLNCLPAACRFLVPRVPLPRWRMSFRICIWDINLQNICPLEKGTNCCLVFSCFALCAK